MKFNQKLPCGKSCGTWWETAWATTGLTGKLPGSCFTEVSLRWPRGSRPGCPRNLLDEIHCRDQPSATGGRPASPQNQEKKPICPPESLSVLYWQSLTLCQLARERCFIITAEKWRGDLGLKGNTFINATAGNNCTWGGKVVDQAQMWKRNLHFNARLATVWFGRGALQNFFNALYWISYCKIIMLLMIVVCQSSFQML